MIIRRSRNARHDLALWPSSWGTATFSPSGIAGRAHDGSASTRLHAACASRFEDTVTQSGLRLPSSISDTGPPAADGHPFRLYLYFLLPFPYHLSETNHATKTEDH